MSTDVRNNKELDRFEIYVDDGLAGIAEYQDTAAERAFVHTEIYSRYGGQGYGRTLVHAALDASRDEGYGILPLCPMVHRFVETRPEYVALVPQWARERFGLPE
ncbi:GNAT family N-acetyltransferase [Nocardia sp. BMG51109]|uniref:GNAT family N-acetyltransferase n=1 Tax=Nocardia sp. BMG51109 TaxID=1056816 RepID=UPI0004661552|nr:GNAT family N-acetyltransferase [Nocardia sp. BMG51109]